jgi:hypothetical protein
MNTDKAAGEADPRDAKIDLLMDQMKKMGEQIAMLTQQGIGLPQKDNTSQRAMAGSEGGEEDLEEVGSEGTNSQHGIGATGSEPVPAGSGWRIRAPLKEGGGRLVTHRSRGENPDLVDGRSIISRAVRKRSENLKPETLKVFKFDGTDYEIWSKAMGFYLESAGLWEVVNGSDPEPEDPEELEEWRLVNNKACNVLFSALSREQQKNVVNCDLAEEMWKTLGQIFARKSKINQAHLIQQYEDYHMKKGVSMQKYLSDIRSLIGKLRGIGVTYHDSSIALKVLRGLSDEYAVDRKILFSQEDLTFEDICGKLLSEALMNTSQRGRAGQGSSSTHTPALANVGQAKERKQKKVVCYICRGEDHITWDCPHKADNPPGERVIICFICKQKGHKSPECPQNPMRAQKKPKSGKGNLAEAAEGSTK